MKKLSQRSSWVHLQSEQMILQGHRRICPLSSVVSCSRKPHSVRETAYNKQQTLSTIWRASTFRIFWAKEPAVAFRRVSHYAVSGCSQRIVAGLLAQLRHGSAGDCIVTFLRA